MKKLFLAVLALSFMMTTAVFAATDAKTMTLKGTIICNKCAAANKDKLADFVKGHPKMCMLHAGCLASGYSLYSDGKLLKFSKDSEAKVAEFLTKEDSKTDVAVTANNINGELVVVSIKS